MRVLSTQQRSPTKFTQQTTLCSLLQLIQKTRAVFVEANYHAIGHNKYQQGTFPSQQSTQFPPYNGSYIQHQQYSNQSFNFSQNHLNYNYNNDNSQCTNAYVPPDPFCNRNVIQSDQMSPFNIVENSVQNKEQILEEIVRECNEIERRSISSESPTLTLSSDEHDVPVPRSHKFPEKKERKKAQNRLAATRYREKKRREKEEAMTCIEGLSVTNDKLKDQVAELEREIRYFKKFMREMGMKNADLSV